MTTLRYAFGLAMMLSLLAGASASAQQGGNNQDGNNQGGNSQGNNQSPGTAHAPEPLVITGFLVAGGALAWARRRSKRPKS